MKKLRRGRRRCGKTDGEAWLSAEPHKVEMSQEEEVNVVR
jgi:hypothetical protein